MKWTEGMWLVDKSTDGRRRLLERAKNNQFDISQRDGLAEHCFT